MDIPLKSLLKLLAYMLPYALIPLTYKFAGGIFATFSGMVDGKSQGLFKRSKEKRAERAHRVFKEGQAFKKAPHGSLRSKINHAGFAVGNVNQAGYNPRNWKGNMSRALSDHSVHQRDAMLEDKDFTWKNNDTLTRVAALANNESELRRMLSASGNYEGADGRANMERDVSRVQAMRKKYGDSSFRQAALLQAVAGGTAFKQSADWIQAATQISGGDDQILNDLVAKGRSAAMGAGRVDQGGAGHGDVLAIAKQFRSNQNYTLDQANAELTDRVLASQGPDTLLHSSMKQGAVENMAPAMMRRLNEAAAESFRTGDDSIMSRAVASTAGLLDAMNRTNPDKANALASQLMGANVEVRVDGQIRAQTTTVRNLIREYTDDEAFNQMRKEYERASQEAAARGGPAGPPGTPPAGPPTEIPRGPI